MADMFRYIEHDFAVPARTDAIDTTNGADFQVALEQAVNSSDGADRERPVAERVRAIAREFLARHFSSPTADPTTLGERLAGLEAAVEVLPAVSVTSVGRLVEDTFGGTADRVVAGRDFKSDLELLQNAVVAVKLVTGFDGIDARMVVRQLRAAAFLTHLADNEPGTLDRAEAWRLLTRPLRIPPGLLGAAAQPGERPVGQPPVDDQAEERERINGLRWERDRLQAAYDKLLVVRPHELELVMPEPPPRVARDRQGSDSIADDGRNAVLTSESAAMAGLATLRLMETVRTRFSDDEMAAMAGLRIEPSETAVPVAVDRITQRLDRLNKELLPIEVPTTAKVFRVGGRLFAETTPVIAPTREVPAQVPDFSKAATRPVGIGNLHVVRQELIGYRAGEISHIENVLEGEELRRWTRRTEQSEIVETDAMVTSQSEERDHQSTDRNELAVETQRETGYQTSRAGETTTSSDYGRLVENSKTNYARTVVAKSVERLDQEVRRQRVRRESRSYVERVGHILDNHDGTNKIRGIYQWVDKLYSLRVLNYGKRLMYDVVVPEPAAVLMQSLKNAAQPESFQLVKPLAPNLTPDKVTRSNYMWYAARYGVTGSVTPPPAVYDKTVSEARLIEGTKSLPAYGAMCDLPYQAAFKLTVPEGYKAVSGYVQRVNAEKLEPTDRRLEVFIGESSFVQFRGTGNRYLNTSFMMAGETGDVPVTVRTFSQVTSMAYAVALVCQRTDEAYAQWQLKTHATITSGYQRQLAEYEERLARYVAAFRAQLAAAGGLAHDPTVTLQELKRAFVFLLLGEHPATWLPTPTPSPAPPGAMLPDPPAVRDWGAVVAFFERAFEWENLMYTCYPYYWARPQRWQELLLTQDPDPQFEAFLKAGAARVVVPVRPGFEAALAHYQETGDVWMGEELPDMFGDHYLSIIEEIKSANHAPGEEGCVEQWEVRLPTTLVLLKEDATLPSWTPTPCNPEP
ncbi:hypothetical protein [Streptomyces sp. NPDC048496]|uniref:hypothetical protein n=1 Tax=Streptomyces sp. NPDC048496 TaxID=3365558 RepID=UPI003720CE12